MSLWLGIWPLLVGLLLRLWPLGLWPQASQLVGRRTSVLASLLAGLLGSLPAVLLLVGLVTSLASLVAGSLKPSMGSLTSVERSMTSLLAGLLAGQPSEGYPQRLQLASPREAPPM